MTVYVHNSVSSFSQEDHEHLRTDSGVLDSNDGRTWSFSCDQPGCEAGLIGHYEFAARNPADVAFTPDETKAQQVLERESVLASGRMAQALAQLAQQQVAAGQQPIPAGQPIL
jgi:hypothetical protein